MEKGLVSFTGQYAPGSQLPLDMPRSDARQNLIDSITCATAGFSPPHVQLEEVAVCFGGVLLRANRTRKTSATIYSAFGSPQYPVLAKLVGLSTILSARRRRRRRRPLRIGHVDHTSHVVD